MKKIKKIGILILVSIMCLVSNVYAASCNVNLQTSKNELDKDEVFTVSVNMANIQSEKGIIILGATLEYDKSALTLQGMEGQNTWPTPSYNEANGKLVTDRGTPTNQNETVFKINFKATGKAGSTTVTLKDISASDGVGDIKVANATQSVTIKGATTPTDPDNNQGNNGNNNNNNNNNNGNTNNNPADNNNNNNPAPDQGTNNNPNTNPTPAPTPAPGTDADRNIKANTNKDKNDKDSLKKGILPEAGAARNIVLVILGGAVVLGAIFYIKMKIIDANMNSK